MVASLELLTGNIVVVLNDELRLWFLKIGYVEVPNKQVEKMKKKIEEQEEPEAKLKR